MKRLTEYTIPETGFSVISQEKYKRILMDEKPSVEKIYNRLKKIEDILGDEYDLDRLSVMVNQCMTMREEVAQRFALTAKIPLDRLRELVEADKDERCVVVPVAIGATVYHITTCKDFPKILDGTLYDGNGALGTATGYYCP